MLVIYFVLAAGQPRAASGGVDRRGWRMFGLGMVSDDPIESEFFAALEVIFTWDPNVLQLQGLDSTGGMIP